MSQTDLKYEMQILRYFNYEHLRDGKMRTISKLFCDLAGTVAATESSDVTEKVTALRKLLEAKDAAVRMVLP